MTVGNCNAGALHHFPTLAGFAGALYSTIQIFGSSVGTSIMASLHERSQIPLSLVLLIVGVSCFISQWVGYSYHKKLEKL